jgi:hypothetical protein
VQIECPAGEQVRVQFIAGRIIQGQIISSTILLAMQSELLLNVQSLKYFGTTTYQKNIQEEIKNRLNSRIACYLSVQNLLSSHLLLKS